jgi:transposase
VPDRDALDAILFVLRSGCQWAALNQTRICSKSSTYRRFREWAGAGVFEALWSALLADPQTTLEWDWLALDSEIVKAPKGGQASGSNPTDRAKSATKRSLCTDASGVPLSVAIDGANRHDVKLLERTLEGLLAAPPPRASGRACASTAATTIRGSDRVCASSATSPTCTPAAKRPGSSAKAPEHAAGSSKAPLAWLVLFRRLKISHERLAATRSAFLNLACALITWRASNPVTRSEAAY